jgi:hypothetical protein
MFSPKQINCPIYQILPFSIMISLFYDLIMKYGERVAVVEVKGVIGSSGEKQAAPLITKHMMFHQKAYW